MSRQKKFTGEERRLQILQLLKEKASPITGSELAAKTNVSRQAIVGDITLLKARNEPILATNQGYMYLHTAPYFEKTIACRHLSNDLERKFNIIVDRGVTIKDVRIEDPIFGMISASIMVSNRMEVKQFMKRLANTKASESTVEIHLLTLSSSSEAALVEAENELKKIAE